MQFTIFNKTITIEDSFMVKIKDLLKEDKRLAATKLYIDHYKKKGKKPGLLDAKQKIDEIYFNL